MEKESSSHTDSLEGHSKLKEEVASQDAVSLKPSVLRSPTVSEGYLTPVDQRPIDANTVSQAKVKCK